MNFNKLPIGTQAFIFAKNYYSVLSKRLEDLEIDRYYSIVLFICHNKGCTQQDVCDSLAIDKTAMVKIIDYLVKANYVERTVNQKNKRQYELFLTELGETRADKINKEFEALDELLLRKNDEKSQIHFLEVMESMSYYLRNLPSNVLSFNYKKTK